MGINIKQEHQRPATLHIDKIIVIITRMTYKPKKFLTALTFIIFGKKVFSYFDDP